MKPYRTAKSTEGLRLPHSPIILGAFADALRLKNSGHPKYKSAQRYFKGERIKPEVVEEVLVALVDAAVPRSPDVHEGGGGEELDLHGFVLQCLRRYAARWDHFVADVNALLFPVASPADLPVPVLRLLALDIGIRYGAWLAVRDLAGARPMAFPPEGFPSHCFAAFLDRTIAERSHTQEEFADEVGVSTQTLAAWRRGGRKGLPTEAYLVRIARRVNTKSESPATTELRLRAMVAVQDLHGRLVERCGAERVDDMLEAMTLTARRVHDLFDQVCRYEPPSPIAAGGDSEERQASVRRRILAGLGDLVMNGAACPTGERLCRSLAEIAPFRPEVATDFLALPGDWADRCRYWMRLLGSAPDQIAYLAEYAKQSDELPDDLAERLGSSAIEGELRMAGFDWHPGPDMQVFVVPQPPAQKAINRVVQADRARSIGDFEGAVEHMMRAVDLNPTSAIHHFKLGALLGEIGARARDMAVMETALSELHIAVQLDPSFGNAKNEIAIVLSNMARHDDAEAAFARAELDHGENAHHWFTRGNNYLALERFDDARLAFEQAIRLSKDGQHLPAKSKLVKALMKLGRTREAKKLAKEVQHLVGDDPVL